MKQKKAVRIMKRAAKHWNRAVRQLRKNGYSQVTHENELNEIIEYVSVKPDPTHIDLK